MYHKTLKYPLPQSLVHIISDDIQRKNATYLLAQSPAHKSITKTLHYPKTSAPAVNCSSRTMLKYLKKNIKKSQCFSSNSRTKSMIKYISYKNLRNLFRHLLSYKNALKLSITSSVAVSNVRSLRSNLRKASKKNQS